jgi:type 1 glutamine amidotransferase
MRTLASFLLLALVAFVPATGRAEDKRIVMIAGKPSHGHGEHEFRAGLLLFQKCLAGYPGIQVEVYSNGWPPSSDVLKGAAAVVIYSDGGAGHPALQGDRLEQLGALMKQGVGLACLHYAVEPTIERGEREFTNWVGGCFEINWSVNPVWEADFKTIGGGNTPIGNGVKPFALKDEWYFNMRFGDGAKKILSALPPLNTISRPDGPHEDNPTVRAMVKEGKVEQTVAWTIERPDGGRGFGFTGGHYHHNWGNDNVRKLVLNAILWLAKVDVPPNGVESTVTEADLAANLDKK